MGLSFGNTPPRISQMQTLPTEHPSELRAAFNLSYEGGFTFEIRTELLINWPVERAGVFPISLSVMVESITGR